MTVLEDLLDDLRQLEENFFAPAKHVNVKLTREQVTALIAALDTLYAVKRAIAVIE
jgi:hypothetical protein